MYVSLQRMLKKIPLLFHKSTDRTNLYEILLVLQKTVNKDIVQTEVISAMSILGHPSTYTADNVWYNVRPTFPIDYHYFDKNPDCLNGFSKQELISLVLFLQS